MSSSSSSPKNLLHLCKSLHPTLESSSIQTVEPIVQFHTILEMGSHDESAYTFGSSLQFLEVPQKGVKKSYLQCFFVLNFTARHAPPLHWRYTWGPGGRHSRLSHDNYDHKTFSWLYTMKTTFELIWITMFSEKQQCQQKDKNTKGKKKAKKRQKRQRGNNTKIQKRPTKNRQGARRAPMPSTGARTRGPAAPKVLVSNKEHYKGPLRDCIFTVF